MRCEAQIAFGYSGAEFPRAYGRIPKPVSTGVENGREEAMHYLQTSLQTTFGNNEKTVSVEGQRKAKLIQ